MKRLNILIICILIVVLAPPAAMAKGPPTTETAGNNLSFPVIWAEGVTKAVPGTPGMAPLSGGAWWYSWGTNGADPNIVPASCAPDPDNKDFCDNGIPGTFNAALVPGTPPADNPMPLVKAYLQKDAKNTWQAASADWSGEDVPVSVDWIDWGDNLESNDWYTRSQVRTEVVLFEDLMEETPDEADGRDGGTEPWLEYAMRHVSGWGIDEVHGMAVDAAGPVLGAGNQATIYSNCARFTIQKLLVKRDNAALADLVWVPGSGWTEEVGSTVNLINEPIFNKAVYEGGDGPGYYSAEINVKGRIIFGYTWNVRQLNDPLPSGPAGDYRLTFSFDQTCGAVNLNTGFVEGVTEIVVPVETEEVAAAAEPTDEGGGTAVLDFADNLTYMDVRILERGGGGGGGGGGKRPREMFMEQERYSYCQEGEGECCEDGSVCLAVRERTGELAQLQARIECEGESCQQFQARLQELVQTLNHVRLRSCTSEGECTCTCENGEDCLQIQDQIREVDRLRDGTCDQCTDGDCPCDVELLDAVGAALYDLALSLANPAQSDFLFLPVLAKDE